MITENMIELTKVERNIFFQSLISEMFWVLMLYLSIELSHFCGNTLFRKL